MKKLLLAVAAITISAASVNAQEKEMHKGGTTFSIAGNVGFGTTQNYKLSAGGDIQAEFPATTGLKITTSAGYQNFAYEIPNIIGGVIKGHSSFIPLLAGVKFHLGSGLYGHGQLGYSISTVKGGTGAFTYAPSIGYGFGKNLDLAVKYFGLSRSGSTIGAIVARLAYNF